MSFEEEVERLDASMREASDALSWAMASHNQAMETDGSKALWTSWLALQVALTTHMERHVIFMRFMMKHSTPIRESEN